jgi:hypothetical protein
MRILGRKKLKETFPKSTLVLFMAFSIYHLCHCRRKKVSPAGFIFSDGKTLKPACSLGFKLDFRHLQASLAKAPSARGKAPILQRG